MQHRYERQFRLQPFLPPSAMGRRVLPLVADDYRRAQNEARVMGASPHELVAILYDELGVAIALMRRALERDDMVRIQHARQRAVTILSALDASLDFDRGGSIATLLTRVYGEARRVLYHASTRDDADVVKRAGDSIAEIADAWKVIGTAPA